MKQIHSKNEMFSRFVIDKHGAEVGFSRFLSLDPDKPVAKQTILSELDCVDRYQERFLKETIKHNVSFRVDFGWGFETAYFFRDMMDECIEAITPNYNPNVGEMITDERLSWLGFMPFNAFSGICLDRMTPIELAYFSDEVLMFQRHVLEFIVSHRTYRDHAILRDNKHRFRRFKNERKDPDALSDLFHYYIESLDNVSSNKNYSRDAIEEAIGMHYLNYPDIFFELLEFYTLKGIIHG